LLEWSRLVPSFPISLVAFSETRLPSEERVGVLEDDDGGDDDVARAQESWQVAHLAPTRVPMVPATICAGRLNRPENTEKGRQQFQIQQHLEQRKQRKCQRVWGQCNVLTSR